MAKIKQSTIDEKYLWVGGGIIVLIIVIFIWGRMSAKSAAKDTSDVTPNINPITVTTSNGTMSWDPSQLVKEVHTAYAVNYSSGRCTVLNKLVDLQDVQLRAIADGYNQAYGKTLRYTLNSAWVACWNFPWQDDPHAQVIKRLDTLQIA